MKLGLNQIKLASGEEVFCTVTDTQKYHVTVTKALKLVAVEMDEDNSVVHILRPWMAYASNLEEDCTLNRQAIVGFVTPSDLVADQYVEAVDSLLEQCAAAKSAYADFVNDQDDSDSPGNVVSLFNDKNNILH